MVEKAPVSKRGNFADWLMRGGLSRIGDTVDQFTGRRWTPSSSLATSELIERIKKLLDAEAKQVPGKGTVVPHNIKLRIQWDKFSADAEEALGKLETELLVAAVDHINDRLYYAYAPVTLDVKADYFIEGVKLSVSFDRFTEDARDVELNVTVPAINVSQALIDAAVPDARDRHVFLARFEIKGEKKEKQFAIVTGGRVSVGRIGSNELMIDDKSVSKIHASLGVAEDGGLSVADTGSTNGTFINDQRISYGKATRLLPGDRVKFGTVEVTFERVAAPEDAAKSDDIVSIEGFEFTRRESTAAPSEDTPVGIPDESLNIEPSDEPETKLADPEEQSETKG